MAMDIGAALRLRPPQPVVAVVRLSGIIGGVGPLRSGVTLSGIERTLERAFRLKRLDAVAVSINSPGGSPVQSELIARRIRDHAEERNVRVIAFCEDVAASGGYWLACAADEIFVQPASIVGSIGVISAGFGFTELLQRVGVERRVYTSGDKKAMLDPFRPEDPEEVDRLKRVQAEIHEAFKAYVRDRRGTRLGGEEGVDLFSGEFWTGPRAIELGLADGVGELRSLMRKRFGKRVQLKRIGIQRPWLKRRLGMGPDGVAAARFGEALAEGLLSAAEERAMWARYGL